MESPFDHIMGYRDFAAELSGWGEDDSEDSSTEFLKVDLFPLKMPSHIEQYNRRISWDTVGLLRLYSTLHVSLG